MAEIKIIPAKERSGEIVRRQIQREICVIRATHLWRMWSALSAGYLDRKGLQGNKVAVY